MLSMLQRGTAALAMRRCNPGAMLRLRSLSAARVVRTAQEAEVPTSGPATPDRSLTQAERASLTAFAARTGIQLSSLSLLQTALTHASFHDKVHAVPSARFQALGAQVLGFYVTENVYFKYPDLPADVLNSVVGAYTHPQTLASVGRIFGLAHVMKWKGSAAAAVAAPAASAATPQEGEAPLQDGQLVVMAKLVQSLLGAMYQDQGPALTRAFIHSHILSRVVDTKAHLAAQLKMQNPKAVLVALAKKLGKERPVARLIKETGRLSATPVYIVGIYCGVDKVGEGYGSSLQMAETRACKDALERSFLTELKDFELPSDGPVGEVDLFTTPSTPAAA